MKKIRIMVLYGGRPGEHEISLRSAASVIRFLDSSRFDVIPVAIDKQGKWLLNDVSLIKKSADSLPVFHDAPAVVLPPHPGSVEDGLIRLGSTCSGDLAQSSGIDVVFPVMHGPLCEDGTIQGLLELADIPYVGCGVLASAVGMDKDVAKRLMKEAGMPIVPYIALKKNNWEEGQPSLALKVEQELSFPVFVKPANLGSSVGVYKVKTAEALDSAIKSAFQFDTKILIEKAVQAREIELAVLEDSQPGKPPLVSIPGEIVPTHEFYSYEAKYLDEDGAKLLIPAKLNSEKITVARKIARQAFEVLECEGMARVDLFLDKDSDHFFFNEINTIPGFTSISMYPKMWEHSGISYQELLSRLVDLAISRHQRKKSLVRNYQQ